MYSYSCLLLSLILRKNTSKKLVFFVPGLQHLKESPVEAMSSGRGFSKLTLLQSTAEEVGGADPDVQLCYCVEATFMDIISSTLLGP